MINTSARQFRRISLWLALFGLLAWLLADLEISTRTPGTELLRLLGGFLAPDFLAIDDLAGALLRTLAFALQGVLFAAGAGFVLACFWQYRSVRAFSAIIRAVHELFWGLLFLQLSGLSTLTGVLAIAIPYSGIFAKVFGEFLEESDPRPQQALLLSRANLSSFFYARLPLVWQQFKVYGAYRLECGIRSSAILGFIGLPTLGFHLETAYRQGDYSAGAALLYIFFILIASMRWWLRARLVPIYLLAALAWLPPLASFNATRLQRFFSHDIVPAPLREDHASAAAFGDWLHAVVVQQGLPGLYNTLVLGGAAMLLTGLLTLLLYPLISRHFFSTVQRRLGYGALVVLRSTPEFLLAFILLLLLGPSMLPGIIALSLHTGGIIAHLLGRLSDTVRLRADSPTGLNRYFYELLPRLYGNFLALLLYRWEIIMRETAILGLIGIPTIGFYIDSAFSEFRLDRAVLLIGLSVLLNLGVDALSRRLRQRLKVPLPEPA